MSTSQKCRNTIDYRTFLDPVAAQFDNGQFSEKTQVVFINDQ